MYSELSRSGRGVEANIELSVCDINVQVGEALEGGGQRLVVGSNAVAGAGSRLTGQMCLTADTINLDTIRLDELDNALSSEGLGTLLNVVVVVEELGLGAVLLGETEGHGKVSLTNGVVPNGLAVGTVLVEG